MRPVLLLLVLFLSGCTSVTCRTYSGSQYVGQRIDTCVGKDIYSSLVEEGKSDEEIFNVAYFGYSNREGIFKSERDEMRICFNEADHHFFSSDYRNSFLAFTDCLDVWKNVELRQYNLKKAEEEEQIKLQKIYEEERKEKEKRDKRLKKKSGVDWCEYRGFLNMVQEQHGKLSKNCMFELNDFAALFYVLQQTSDGTLIYVPGDNFICLIEKNSVDRECVDNELVKGGVFVNKGTYQYTNTLGSTKTIYKLRRIE